MNLFPSHNRTSAQATRPRTRAAAVLLLPVLLAGSLLAGAGSATAANVPTVPTVPTFQDLVDARGSVAGTAAEIVLVEGLQTGLAANVKTAGDAAVKAGNAAQVAQSALDVGSVRADNAVAAAVKAEERAKASRVQAALMAVQTMRSGGADITTTLLVSGSNATKILSKLALADVIRTQSASVYAAAARDQKTVASVTAQALKAKDALTVLAATANAAATAAAATAQTATTALADQQTQTVTLTAQLSVLLSATEITEAEYAAALTAAGPGVLHPGGIRTGPTTIAANMWVRPSAGHISSPYGYRIDPFTGMFALHEGTDLAPACNAPILAAHAGTVTLAGPYGGYGNYIRIQNTDDSTVQTAYGHIVDGGIQVHIGDTVTAGQLIGLVGSTGWSTGCHLHFEVHRNGVTTDPVPYMAGVGVNLTN